MVLPNTTSQGSLALFSIKAFSALVGLRQLRRLELVGFRPAVTRSRSGSLSVPACCWIEAAPGGEHFQTFMSTFRQKGQGWVSPAQAPAQAPALSAAQEEPVNLASASCVNELFPGKALWSGQLGMA